MQVTYLEMCDITYLNLKNLNYIKYVLSSELRLCYLLVLSAGVNYVTKDEIQIIRSAYWYIPTAGSS